MNETTPLSPSVPAPTAPEGRGGFTAWPLLIALCGVIGVIALFLEGRPDANGTDFDYPVTAEDVLGLDHVPYRLSGAVGYLLALLLIATAVVWRHRVERRFPGSSGATAVSFGVIATAALVTLTYGWRGAVGNYLPGGPEADTYDAEGLYNYYIMTDFSPYIAFIPLLASAYGLAWMAFREQLVSRGLGALAGLFASALLVAVFVTGVPGLPSMIIIGLIAAGIWLAVGRSPITAVQP
ncbi:hypothetical protein KVF89_15045 [Nocardioides carbamazepini]|uniref:hypothetical protein n=1 Tax=Nocardioides carbamazepini TaxID=2854259 RepID=UPI002149AF7A|nr:hypothetical protein [Nocardioides carbamazepini]MCR1783855.1 hypothetical protein [Nocardioides carbamazepini]